MRETGLNREYVNDKLIVFDNLLKEIMLRTFNIVLPPSFKNLFDSDKTSHTVDRDQSNNQKKRHKTTEGDQQKVTNSGKIEDWCLDSERFKTKFRDSEALKI